MFSEFCFEWTELPERPMTRSLRNRDSVPAFEQPHRRIDAGLCQQHCSWPRSCCGRNASTVKAEHGIIPA